MNEGFGSSDCRERYQSLRMAAPNRNCWRSAPRRQAPAHRLSLEGQAEGPALLWLSGFLSDMASTKATRCGGLGGGARPAMMRFDYSGHGLSGGDLLDATIGDWLEKRSRCGS